MTNLHDKQQSKETHYVLLFIDRNTVGTEYIQKEVLTKIKDKSISHIIFRIQSDKSIMCGFYCIAFIEYMPPGKFVRLY